MKKILCVNLFFILFNNSAMIEQSLQDLNFTLKNINKIILMATFQVTDPNAQSFPFKNVTIHVVQQNMFTLPAQAVVNAASTALLGGGGVDAAVHNAAGPALLVALTKQFPNGTPTGTAVITKSFNLGTTNPNIKYIIHAVGPICSRQVTNQQKKQLESAHYESLQRADEFKLTSLAFSAISSGIYGCATALVAKQAAQAVKEFLKNYPHTTLKDIYFTLYGDPKPSDTKQKVATYKQVFTKEFSKSS